jgi:hypothetical protein
LVTFFALEKRSSHASAAVRNAFDFELAFELKKSAKKHSLRNVSLSDFSAF